MKIVALCHDCAHQHPIDFDPTLGPGAAFGDWLTKHPGHAIDFAWPERSRKVETEGLGPLDLYLPNADIKIAYAASAAYTITLASLATSATLVAGQESTAIDNTTNKYLDYLVGGKITTGTTPTTAKSIQIWAYGSVNDSPTYPDVFDGTDSAETVTSGDIRNAGLNFLGDTAIDATSDRAYWFRPVSLAAIFGGALPKFHGLWVTHDTAVNLNATGGNHVLNYTPVYATSV